ncbi:hypothetical protein HYS31_00900 [Candidatus Woesearchaeota archaeon]|nr:hypothetical protein [Candidatus Woesearchaeota archaeon]
MNHPIVEKILKDGINSVNLSMLDEATKKKILGDVGDKLFRQHRFIEAIDIIARANDAEKLIKLGDLFLLDNKGELAALCFIPTKDKQRLNSAAAKCVEAQNYKLAAMAYEAAENVQMASFMKENFAGG